MSVAAFGFLVAFLVSASVAVPGIRYLRRLKAGHVIGDQPASHAAKSGTPTMGGLFFLAGFVAVWFLLQAWEPGLRATWPLLVALAGFGGIGLLDDYQIVKRGKNAGLRWRVKLGLQFVAAALWAGTQYLVWHLYEPIIGGTFFDDVYMGGLLYKQPIWLAAAAVLMVVAANAVNYADGLDGLAAGMAMVVCVGFALAFGSFSMPLGGPIWLLALALAGGLAGFLWHNGYPARVFMGDTGSLALGALLVGIAALDAGGEAFRYLMIAMGLFWAILASSTLQTGYYKMTKGKRIFRRAPLHHHFEELGWPEQKVTVRFWLVTAACVALALAVVTR